MNTQTSCQPKLGRPVNIYCRSSMTAKNQRVASRIRSDLIVEEPRRKRGFLHRFEQRLAIPILRRLADRNRQDGFPQIAVLAHDHIGQQIAIFGQYEHDLLAAIDRQLLTQVDVKSRCAIDIGANVGNHTIAFAERFVRVHAFEPNSTAFRLLQANTAELDNVHCHNLALSNSEKDLQMHVTSGNVGGACVTNNPDSLVEGDIVKAVSLDAFRRRIHQQVGLIKIDVEGHEMRVLQGAVGVLKEEKPVVLFEQLALEEKVFNLMLSLGYTRFGYFSDATLRSQIRFLSCLQGWYRGIGRLLFGSHVEIKFVTSWKDLPQRPHSLVVAMPQLG